MKKTVITVLVITLIALLFCSCARYGDNNHISPVPDGTAAPGEVTGTIPGTVATPDVDTGIVDDHDGIIGDKDATNNPDNNIDNTTTGNGARNDLTGTVSPVLP